jgi:hypothetical protein
VYVGQLSDFESPRFLEVSRPVGWRYLVLQGNQAALSLEIDESAGGSPAFNALRRGTDVKNTITALEKVAADLASAADEYEIRLYDVPSMYFTALWLAGSLDVLVPLPTPGQPKGLEAFSSYSPEAIWPILNQEAHKRLKDDSAPEDDFTATVR